MSRRGRRRRRRARAPGAVPAPDRPPASARVSFERLAPHLLRVRVVPGERARMVGGCAGMTSALLFASVIAPWFDPSGLSPVQHLAHLVLAPLLALWWLGSVALRDETLLDREQDLLTRRAGVPGLRLTRRRRLGDAAAVVHTDSPRPSPRYRAALRVPGGEVVPVGPPRARRAEASQDAAALRSFLNETAPPPAALAGADRERPPAAAADAWFTGGEPAPADCPLCRDPVSGDGEGPRLAVVACRGCGTRYHEPCALELGRCAVLGCARARDPGRARARHD